MRLFCALDLPGPTAALIGAWQRRQIGPESPWRAVRAESLHVTLCFLGDRSAAEAERAAAIVAAVEAGGEPVRGELDPEPVPLPRRQPRLLALAVTGAAIPRLQGPLAAALQAAGLYEPEKRPFWPHVTVMRRRGAGSRRRRGDKPGGSLRVGRLPAAESPEGTESGHAFGAVRVALYVSETRPGGSEYTRLAARDLPS